LACGAEHDVRCVLNCVLCSLMTFCALPRAQ